jgi:EmrB/QacA subfamily drug resistance transporter
MQSLLDCKERNYRMNKLPYKWVVAIVMIFGMFMTILDTTVINVATPRLESAFGAGLKDVDWVATGYTLAEGVGTPLSPFMTSWLGTKRLFLIALSIFTLSSALCGLSWSLQVLIFFRILQGIGGSCLMPVSIATIYSVFPPEERGMAMGTLGVPLLLAPALGPVLGGYLVTYVSWQAMFYINLPIGILAFILGMILLRPSEIRHGLYFDFPGLISSAIGLSSILYAFSSASDNGWDSADVHTFLVIGVGAILIFVAVELLTIQNGKQPLLDLRCFGSLSFTGGTISLVAVIFAMYAGMYLLPVFLQQLRGQTAYESGLIQFPTAIAGMVSSFIGGILVDRLGTKPVAIPGLILLCVSAWGLSYTTLNTPFDNLQIWLIIRGLCLGMTMQPITQSALAGLKMKQVSQGSTINSVIRDVASSLAVATATTLTTTQTAVHYARLAEQVTVGSPAGNLLQQMAGLFQSRGMTQANAMTAAMEVMYQQLQEQAMILAMRDVYLLTLVAGIITIFVVLLLIKGSPSKAKRQQLATQNKNKKAATETAQEEEEEGEVVMVH